MPVHISSLIALLETSAVRGLNTELRNSSSNISLRAKRANRELSK